MDPEVPVIAFFTFAIFALDCTLSWIEAQGGVSAMATRNEQKAALLYQEIDRSDFWSPAVATGSRSLMNPTWRTPSPDVDKAFVAEATAAGLVGLKGHRIVGGLRASIYNACSLESVQELVTFMQDFEKRHG